MRQSPETGARAGVAVHTAGRAVRTAGRCCAMLGRSSKAGTAAVRNKLPASPTAVVKAGSLGYELEGHAVERANHFFFYVVTMKLVVETLNRLGVKGAPFKGSHFVEVKATDQIGTGHRASATDYRSFVETDAGVVDLPTTQFNNMDAAHFCNLGLKLGLDAACKGDPFTFDCYESLKALAGNTMLLPQKINIGPDRKLDILHGKLALEMLDDGQVIFSRDRVTEYRDRAHAALGDYAEEQDDRGLLGLSACASHYRMAYSDSDFVGRVYRRVYPEIIARAESSQHFRGQQRLFLV